MPVKYCELRILSNPVAIKVSLKPNRLIGNQEMQLQVPAVSNGVLSSLKHLVTGVSIVIYHPFEFVTLAG